MANELSGTNGAGCGFGGIAALYGNNSIVYTPEVVAPKPGQVAMGRVVGLAHCAVNLSSTGQLVYPNKYGIVVVSFADAAVMKNQGWLEVAYETASVPPSPGSPT